MKKILVLLTISFLFHFTATAENIVISKTTDLLFTIPDGWLLAKDPPQRLLEEMAEHISHEAGEKGYSPTKKQLLAAARKRLDANEVLLYNPETLAYLTLDLSHLRQGERAPTKKSIKLSAKYTGESLEQEEGVQQLVGSTEEATIEGAWYAYRYNASYRHHEEKMAFSGVIGFSPPYWFFFYYIDYLHDPIDKDRAEQVFESLKIVNK